ncbi:dual specificity protein phosphatase [Hahella aquimaris]|uniref:dual specificity protein phosphatase family protein n=1 Tax=Hahella sp. HNIBRBA332 TaxID=3015983 RepID=UPI00273ADD27|nr:dual specificity protein phosphatase [Hahella sp. HNIBRBA332]WLQ16624.1 dual specificity protein phosphatase [Hahella sp. HNIBRBA332]
MDAKDVSDVDAVLCLKEECCDEDNTDVDVLCLPLIDGRGNDKRLFNDAVDFIHDVVSSGDRILVHCHAGRSRSVCIVARYFMMKQGITSHQALSMISAKREIYLSPGIEEILILR